MANSAERSPVRIHEAGHDDTAGGVERRFVGVGGTQVTRGADGSDLLVAQEHRAVFDDVERAEVGPALGAGGEGQELGGGVD
jgi:hypothetical protein